MTPDSRPALPRFVKLRFDRARDTWLLLAPERILIPDEIAVEVLKLCDGEATLSAIAAILAARYDAPEAQILTDVTAMLGDLEAKGFLCDREAA
ncbi:pyrroloquinoline quinone biosynthesis peptide chaperone PqqD [Limimaricola variabilis]|uniref:pyrroloquinoline quinone biosynthesis peptide chaperone PqqD n=1 Tax=Limimaricola variabilis TaxID=1492771 RepID=UPI002AC9F18D|nr:pyrroloquinoline quinone biosynthesis peptide chaperone PqqD [Limimaricola variabilis]WPY94975.1 pyrroloquinoline quinone biosynthesis peptide chaperone PqqD [Limimaricola variabilis]